MSRELKPTGLDPAFLRECFDVLSADPPLVRWRGRPRGHFGDTDEGERAFRHWGKTYAGQIIRTQAGGRQRLGITGPDGEKQILDTRSIIAEIGVTPIGNLWGVACDAPNDRLAEERALAGRGKLAAVMQAAMAETGRTETSLEVLSTNHDPYRIDTPAKHRDAKWFAAQVARFIDPNKKIHPRGLYYACISAGDVVKPDGEPFAAADVHWLGRAASYARWLGYIGFDRLVDNKNDEPDVREAPSTAPPSATIWANNLPVSFTQP